MRLVGLRLRRQTMPIGWSNQRRIADNLLESELFHLVWVLDTAVLRVPPEANSMRGRINPLLFPPILLVPNVVQRPVMSCAKRYGPFITHFTAQSFGLSKA